MRTFLEQLDTAGGHIMVCLALIGIGAGFYVLKIPKAEDLIVGATGVLFAAMRGATKPQ
jgi:hypothetical protein